MRLPFDDEGRPRWPHAPGGLESLMAAGNQLDLKMTLRAFWGVLLLPYQAVVYGFRLGAFIPIAGTRRFGPVGLGGVIAAPIAVGLIFQFGRPPADINPLVAIGAGFLLLVAMPIGIGLVPGVIAGFIVALQIADPDQRPGGRSSAVPRD